MSNHVLSAPDKSESDKSDLPSAEASETKAEPWFASIPLIILTALMLSCLIIGAAWFIERDKRMALRAEMARVAATDAQDALDRGDERSAINAALAAWSAHSPPVPEARAALTRVALEARLLADIPLGATAPLRLRLLPDNRLAVIETGGRTHLVDLASGTAARVYDPELPSFVRISESGDTLWTAHFEPPVPDDAGGTYAPLLFEEATLSTGEVRFASAVRSVPPQGVSGDISPDGALFAADLGPGGGAETVVGIFRREAQALAGLVMVPSDVADVRFAGPGTLIAAAPPAAGIASGVSLWRLGDTKTMALLPPPGACDGPRAAPPDVSPEGAEILLGAQGCLLRWSAKTGAPAQPLPIGFTPDRTFALAAGGPYLAAGGERASLVRDDGRALALPECRGAQTATLGTLNGRAALACGGTHGIGMIFGTAGTTRWAAPAVPASTLLLNTEEAQLYTIGADGRLRIWDARARATLQARAAPVTRPAADLAGPAVHGRACTAPWMQDAGLVHAPEHGRAAALKEGQLSIYDLEACAPLLRVTTKKGAGGEMGALAFDGPDRLRVEIGGESLVLSLAIKPEAALADMRRRQTRLGARPHVDSD